MRQGKSKDKPGKKRPGRRSTNAEVAARLGRLEMMIVTVGWSMHSASAFAAAEDRSLDQIMLDRRAIHKKWARDNESLMGVAGRIEWIRQLHGLRAVCLERGNETAAVRAHVEIGRALGYYSAEKHEVAVTGQVEHTHVDLRRLTDAELAAYEELVVKATADPPLLLEVVK